MIDTDKTNISQKLVIINNRYSNKISKNKIDELILYNCDISLNLSKFTNLKILSIFNSNINHIPELKLLEDLLIINSNVKKINKLNNLKILSIMNDDHNHKVKLSEMNNLTHLNYNVKLSTGRMYPNLKINKHININAYLYKFRMLYMLLIF